MLEICEIGEQGLPSGRWSASTASTFGECGLWTASEVNSDCSVEQFGVTKTQLAKGCLRASSNESRLRGRTFRSSPRE